MSRSLQSDSRNCFQPIPRESFEASVGRTWNTVERMREVCARPRCLSTLLEGIQTGTGSPTDCQLKSQRTKEVVCKFVGKRSTSVAGSTPTTELRKQKVASENGHSFEGANVYFFERASHNRVEKSRVNAEVLFAVATMGSRRW